MAVNAKSPEVLVRFRIEDLVSRRSFIFARAGFGRRIAEAVLACADEEAVEALARDGLG